MAPIQVAFITTAYDVINTGGNSVNAIRKAFQKGLMVLDGGVTDAIVTFLENVVDWFFGKIINDFKDYVILACLIRIEYAIRSGSLQIMKALFLKNKCSKCGQIGHNAQNHSDALQAYLQGKGVLGNVNDVLENGLDDE